MTDYAVCPTCGTALTSATCNACVARSVSTRGATAATHYSKFWQRFLIASVPAAILALFVESTLYGYALYLGVYLTYCAWGEATAPQKTADDQRPASSSFQLTANS